MKSRPKCWVAGAESAPVVEQESAGGQAETLCAKKTSILLGASESVLPDAQQPVHRANRRVVTVESGRSAWLDQSVEASRHARCRAQAVGARTGSRHGSPGSIERRAAATAALRPPPRSESPRPSAFPNHAIVLTHGMNVMAGRSAKASNNCGAQWF